MPTPTPPRKRKTMKKVMGIDEEAVMAPPAPATRSGVGARAVARAPTPKRIPIQNRTGLRPKWSARRPATIAPRIVPMVAMATIMPSPKEDSAYRALSFSSAPEMTAVSKPNSRPPREATIALRMTRGEVFDWDADGVVIHASVSNSDGTRGIPRIEAPRGRGGFSCDGRHRVSDTIGNSHHITGQRGGRLTGSTPFATKHEVTHIGAVSAVNVRRVGKWGRKSQVAPETAAREGNTIEPGEHDAGGRT